MAQSGIHAFAGILLSKFLKYEKWLISSMLLGLILPDLDIIFVVLGIIDFKSSFLMHSLFFIILTYLVFLSLAEITSNKKFKSIGKGLCVGILIHIIIDVFFWFKSVYLFWPMPIKTNYSMINYKNELIINVLLAFEFLFFRFYGWLIIKKYIEKPNNEGWFVKYISKWMKLEFILFIFFLLLIYFDTSNYRALFTAMYIPSLIMALISTYILRDTFN